VRVAGQILKHALRAAKRGLNMHDPIDRGSLLTKGSKRSRFGQRMKFPVEVERALAESLF